MDRFKLMTTYEAVVRLGGYTPAARELGVTRAMISKRVQELEIALNVKLLNRTTQRFSTTEAGDEYYENCISLLGQLRSVEERLLARRREPRGELKILCSKTFGELKLAPILARFSREFPGIRPQLVLRDLGADEHDLISRGFDLAIRPRPIATTSLIAKPVVPLPRTIVASPRYIERNGAPSSPGDLKNHNCLSPNGESRNVWEFLGAGKKLPVRVAGTFKCASSTVIRHAALEGVGIALVGEYVVENDLRTGRLTKLLEAYAVPERMLYVLYQRDHYQPLRLRLFIDFLSSAMKIDRKTRKPLSNST